MSQSEFPLIVPMARRTLDCRGILFEEIQHAEAFRMGKHSHEQAHMAFLCKGSIENFKPNRGCLASTSALMFMPPGETHATQYGDGVHAFYIRFASSWWARIETSMPMLQEAQEYQNSPPSWFALRIYYEFLKGDDLTPLQLEGLTLELLVAMARQGHMAANRGVPRWLAQTQEYLHSHFCDRLSLQEIARVVEVHPGHLMRGFRQHHHCTIGHYVRKLRVQGACRLMRDSEQSLGEIAQSLGFSDQSHFCKTFKQITGMTPAQWQIQFVDVPRIQKR